MYFIMYKLISKTYLHFKIKQTKQNKHKEKNKARGRWEQKHRWQSLQLESWTELTASQS